MRPEFVNSNVIEGLEKSPRRIMCVRFYGFDMFSTYIYDIKGWEQVEGCSETSIVQADKAQWHFVCFESLERCQTVLNCRNNEYLFITR